MTLWHRITSIVAGLIHRDRTEQQLQEELTSFVEIAAAEQMREGATPDEARRLARLQLGGAEQVKELVRTRRHGALLDETIRDVRHALRMCLRTPVFTTVVLITLTLGIGANTAMFGILDALMLQSLPVPNAQELRIVSLRERADAADPGSDAFSYALARALAARREAFASAAGFEGTSFVLSGSGAAVRVPGAWVTGGYYETLGLRPAAGRLLSRADDEPGAPLVAVISDAFWQSHFAGAVSAVDSTLVLNGISVTIAGVSPRGFSGAIVGAVADITLPVAALPQLQPSMAGIINPGNFFLRVLARPATGLTPEAAAVRLNAAWPAFAGEVVPAHWPMDRRQAMTNSIFVLSPGANGWTPLRDTYERPLWVLLGVAGLVLLIACSTIASLFLARASTRQREFAVRLTMGASRARIARQLLTESALLSTVGAVLGLGIAWISSRFLLRLISTGPFRVAFDLSLNSHVLAFSAGLAVLTALIFGLAPAAGLRQANPIGALKNDTRAQSPRSRLLPSLITVQVALSLVLLAGAALFVQTLRNLRSADLGFRPDHVFVIQLEHGKGSPEQLLDVVRRTPGVVAAGLATHTPFDWSSWTEAIVPLGQPLPKRDNTRVIGAGQAFLETLGVELTAGRMFTESDRLSTGIAIVNQRYAEQFFPKQNPVGRHLVSTIAKAPGDLEIVGVVKNTRVSSLRRVPPTIVYVPIQPTGSLSIAFRTDGPTGQTVEAVRTALQRELPLTPIEIGALSAQIGGTIVQDRLMAVLATGFGMLALLLAAVGLYGLLAYSVAQRTREIGIRMALGARSSGVVGLVLSKAAVLVGLGIAIGYPAARAASKPVESMLYGLKPSDPAAMSAAIAILVATALAAAYLPARRASRVDPLTVLRRE